MNITYEKGTGNVQQLSIDVYKADYYENVETALKKYRRTAQIPGFRVGNAPIGLIKRNYEKPLIVDEVNKITSENLYGYFEKNNINIMFEPMLIEQKSSIDFEKNEDFVFTFEFAVQPEFEIDFATLPIMKVFKINATKDEIEDYLNQIRKRHGDYINPETIEYDDYVTIKWGESETGFFFMKDLTEKGKEWFLGRKTDDTINLSFSEMFVSKETLKKFLKKSNDNFEGINLNSAEVKISSIGRANLAEINDEFFKKAFPDGSITTVAAFENLAAQQIEAQWKQETDRKFMNDAIAMLMKNIQIDLPEDFIKRFILKNNNEINEDKLNQEWKKYSESFKWQLIESKLGKENNIEVSLDDIKNHIRNFYYQNYFIQFNLTDVEDRLNKMVEEAVKDKKQVKQLYDQLFDQKILELLLSKMNLEEIDGNFNQFITFMAEKEQDEDKENDKNQIKESSKEKAKSKKQKEVEENGELKPKQTRRLSSKKNI
ncbi:MAG: hypothetical protein LBU83_06215 [Bacteroidales bacterium]|jgi:trigger factor|nr:hypothetical protein [Bacteroidales bacterium]